MGCNFTFDNVCIQEGKVLCVCDEKQNCVLRLKIWKTEFFLAIFERGASGLGVGPWIRPWFGMMTSYLMLVSPSPSCP